MFECGRNEWDLFGVIFFERSAGLEVSTCSASRSRELVPGRVAGRLGYGLLAIAPLVTVFLAFSVNLPISASL